MNFILKGNICYSKNINKIESIPNGYIICSNGKSLGVFEQIPKEYDNFPIHDYGDRIIIPGLIDLHIHAPQYPFHGYGMDSELLDWLEHYAFPEEAKYSDINYANKAYKIFADCLLKSATTRACIFATIHTKSTILLMDILEKTGMITYVGKVSMDRNAPENLCETVDSAKDQLISWIESTKNAYENTKPILTPRFIPACSNYMLENISEICEKYSLPIQSHLSENLSEIKLVSKLCPDSEFYGDAYNMHGLFGISKKGKKKIKTVMAHCVHSNDSEIKLLAENGVFAAHCPASNTNLCSGIAPIVKLLENGVKVGLGSDVAGGHSESIFRAVTDAVQVSKLYSCIIDSKTKPLTFAQSFYLATKGGGKFFGKVGSFEKDYELDAVILDDIDSIQNLSISIENRLERFAYLSLDNSGIYAKYVNGKKII